MMQETPDVTVDQVREAVPWETAGRIKALCDHINESARANVAEGVGAEQLLEMFHATHQGAEQIYEKYASPELRDLEDGNTPITPLEIRDFFSADGAPPMSDDRRAQAFNEFNAMLNEDPTTTRKAVFIRGILQLGAAHNARVKARQELEQSLEDHEVAPEDAVSEEAIAAVMRRIKDEEAS
jgi:hypothetical protein